MKKLIAKFLDAFWNDELAARRWLRGGLTASVAIFPQLLVDPNWPKWTVKEWVVRLIPAMFGFAAGSMQSSAKKNGAEQPK